MQIGIDAERSVDQKRIFIIENDGITGAILQFMLQEETECHDLATLEEAYEKADKWAKPHLVMLGEGIMRENGGAGLAKVLAERWPEARIVVIAEKADDPLIKDTMVKGGGAHGFLTKPLTVENVRRKVDLMLGRAKAEFVQLGDF
jgi:DNA-binding NtrC family response regulator